MNQQLSGKDLSGKDGFIRNSRSYLGYRKQSWFVSGTLGPVHLLTGWLRRTEGRESLRFGFLYWDADKNSATPVVLPLRPSGHEPRKDDV